MMGLAFLCKGALHPAAIGDGFVIPLFQKIDGGLERTYVQISSFDQVIAFDRIYIDRDDVLISTNESRSLYVGDRPLFGFYSKSRGLFVGNFHFLSEALGEVGRDYDSDSRVYRRIRAFLSGASLNKSLDPLHSTAISVDTIKTREIEVYCGSNGPQRAIVTLEVDGQEKTVTSRGDGPIDACFNAIGMIVPHEARLDRFDLSATTSGTKVPAETYVVLSLGSSKFLGVGRHQDTMVLAAKAYVDALNQMIATKHIILEK